ncbi:short-subunit dehydrogenase [Pseudoduganella flava]|uniref:SDR family oxidoreductase n=1 Tax=Pseudoduganella flava TaxID=871742 RepID=A0A562Q1X1_9BURK|nr:SDR family oxidoreductase [Pseudoduganella flava]QGZ38153.1 SDR family oxidoreductase [Pseudoduganella flava]TWI50326.1 short-subunit dehydrogenase [Pseudoduganella flava]
MSTLPHRAVLTGATGGIGRAIARSLAPSCEWLVVCSRDGAALAALRNELGAGRVHAVQGDLTDDATLARVAAQVAELGAPNLLINNAGMGDFHAFESQDAARIRALLATNLLAPILLTQRLLPLLRQAPVAQIVNVGSLFGYIGYPGFAAYAASKSGLRGFTQALRRELADTPIAVRHFIPRATRTAINSAAVDALNDEMGTPVDAPEDAAAQLLRFLAGSAWERKPGVKEALLVLLNHALPGLPDKAIRGQLPGIRKHMPK